MFSFFDTTYQPKTEPKGLASVVIFFASLFLFYPIKTENNPSNLSQITYRYQFDEDQKRLIPLEDIQPESDDVEQKKNAHHIKIIKTDHITYRLSFKEGETAEFLDWIALIQENPTAIIINFQIASFQSTSTEIELLNEKIITLFTDQGFCKDCILTTIELAPSKTNISDNNIEITIFFSNNTLDSVFH